MIYSYQEQVLNCVINPFQTNGTFHKATYNKVRMVHCIYQGPQVIISKKYCISFSEDRFCLENSADQDEMLHFATFHLGLHCLSKYLFRGNWYPE